MEASGTGSSREPPALPAPRRRAQEEMSKAGLDMVYRDFCAHLLIPLNECRRKTLFLPWKCEAERHA